MHRRRPRNLRITIACLLGACIAFWLSTNVLPRTVVYTDEDGTWESIEFDWDRRLLEVGRERPRKL